MNIVFAGTPVFALEPFVAIAEAGYRIAAVLTQPDRPQGRKGRIMPSPVKEEALARGIPVLQPEHLKSDMGALKDVKANLMDRS